MGVQQWSRTFTGKQTVIDTLFGGQSDDLGPSSSVQVHGIHGDGDVVIVEHSGHNELGDGHRYDNNYCWVFEFRDSEIQRVREYMDTQLVTETFGPDETTYPLPQDKAGTPGKGRAALLLAPNLGDVVLPHVVDRPLVQKRAPAD